LSLSSTVSIHFVPGWNQIDVDMEVELNPIAMLRNVKAVISTSLEISSIQEMPELKKYLRMTLTR